MNYIVYVLVSNEGKHYVGYTKNLERRLLEHNTGGSFYTKQGTGWKVVYIENHECSLAARRREKYFKSHAGKEWLQRRKIL